MRLLLAVSVHVGAAELESLLVTARVVLICLSLIEVVLRRDGKSLQALQ
jgi:hypothetical protein